MSCKMQQYSKKAESKKRVLAEKPDDGAIHMPLTRSDAAQPAPHRPAFLGMTTAPTDTHPTHVASRHSAGFCAGPPWDPDTSRVPTQSPLPLVHKDTGTWQKFRNNADDGRVVATATKADFSLTLGYPPVVPSHIRNYQVEQGAQIPAHPNMAHTRELTSKIVISCK